MADSTRSEAVSRTVLSRRAVALGSLAFSRPRSLRKRLTASPALPLAAGAGLAFVLELTDNAIRRSSDLFTIVDNRLVVPVPYIATKAELRGQKYRRFAAVVLVVVIVVALLGGTYFFMPPLDLMLAKARAGLFR